MKDFWNFMLHGNTTWKRFISMILYLIFLALAIIFITLFTKTASYIEHNGLKPIAERLWYGDSYQVPQSK